jgi:hypothetical protein
MTSTGIAPVPGATSNGKYSPSQLPTDPLTDFSTSDYNYQLHADGSCELVEGLEPENKEEYCQANPDMLEFFSPTGYRRIPLTTCEGGRELDKSMSHPCPGHEEQYNKKHGLSGAGLFFVIIVPIIIAIAVGYWVYQKWLQGYNLGFGEIRLGDTSTGAARATSGGSPFIAIPVAIIAGTWAVAKATPLLVMSLWRSARGYVPVGTNTAPYRSREAFGARRQDYSQVVEDDELLGDDLEDGEDV